MLENVIKSHCISLLLKTRCLSFTVAYRQHGKHALADVEGVSPVVVQNHSVVFPDSQQPPAQRLGEDGRGRGRLGYGSAVMAAKTRGDSASENLSPV